METQLAQLKEQLKGELKIDALHKGIYATDASVYRKIPLGVAYPKDTQDLKTLIAFASQNKSSLIPRTAGTSLAGQCVGEGLIVDVSKHFTEIISLDKLNKQVTVRPGVIRDELNLYLKPFGLFLDQTRQLQTVVWLAEWLVITPQERPLSSMGLHAIKQWP
jgi:hypothetical protein